jgi:hypothetical protein
MNVNEMTFGVEIECYVRRTALTEHGWRVASYHHGTGGETHGEFPGWRVETDSSLHNEPSMAHRGIEVVSPILSGAEGLATVARMMTTIQAMGGRVNSTCGFHVHVGFDREQVDALVRLIYLSANVQDALFASTGSPDRVHSDYCRPVKENFRALKTKPVRSYRALKHDAPCGCLKMNMVNISQVVDDGRPTVEFRVFQGTLNVAKARGYVQMALGLVQLASEYARRMKWDAAPPRAPRFTGGLGERHLKRLFVLLGWVQMPGLTYGPHHKEGETPKQFGVLDASRLREVMDVLLRMAQKFDGLAVRCQDIE